VSAPRFREVLISPASVSWIKDREQIIVMDEQRQEIFVLRGVEAVVWDCLVLTYPYSKIVRSLTVMLEVSSEEAEKRLWTIFQKWIRAGLLGIEAG